MNIVKHGYGWYMEYGNSKTSVYHIEDFVVMLIITIFITVATFIH